MSDSCYLCGSRLMIEYHHTIPRSIGGHSSRLVPLCKECHALVHLIILKLTSGRYGDADALYRSKGVDEQRLKELVSLAVKAHEERFRKVPLDNPQEVRLTLPRLVRAAVKRAAHDQGVTVNDFILNAVLKELRRLGWRLQNDQTKSSPT